jgi:hypothetical protein
MAAPSTEEANGPRTEQWGCVLFFACFSFDESITAGGESSPLERELVGAPRSGAVETLRRTAQSLSLSAETSSERADSQQLQGGSLLQRPERREYL